MSWTGTLGLSKASKIDRTFNITESGETRRGSGLPFPIFRTFGLKPRDGATDRHAPDFEMVCYRLHTVHPGAVRCRNRLIPVGMTLRKMIQRLHDGCPARVRGLPQMRLSRTRFPASALQ